jgi:hypothetical protein
MPDRGCEQDWLSPHGGSAKAGAFKGPQRRNERKARRSPPRVAEREGEIPRPQQHLTCRPTAHGARGIEGEHPVEHAAVVVEVRVDDNNTFVALTIPQPE